MEFIILTLAGNGIIAVGAGLGNFFVHKWNQRKLKKKFAELTDRIETHEQELQKRITLPVQNEPINETPSEKNYEQVLPRNHYHAY